MIKLFRNIRHRLIESGSLRKYLVYALGEIVLVVIGILIALQINNWNEEHKVRQSIQVYLQNLKENITDDRSNMYMTRTSALFRYHSGQYLIRLAGYKPYHPEPDGHINYPWEPNRIWNDTLPTGYNQAFIGLAFLWTHRIAISNLNTGTVEELKNTGLFSRLAKSLKDSLNAYYTDWDFRFGITSQETIHNGIQDWQRSLRKVGISNSDPFVIDDPVQLLREDPERIGLLRFLAGVASWHLTSADIMLREADNLIKEIEKYEQKL
ncbi:MAG: hypothetical protein H6570_16735 [Lewinellaceae bacterium]|nr:hypothetical protein [Lewinellaceae bacterium]